MLSQYEVLAAMLAGHDALADVTGLRVKTGRLAAPEQGAPPRVVLVPTRDEFGPPTGLTPLNTSWAPGDAQNQPGRLRCEAGVELHVWGSDLATTEVLRNKVLLALDQTLGAALLRLSGQWLTQQAAEAGWLRRGELYVLSAAVSLSIAPDPWPVVDVAFQCGQTPGTPGDGILNCTEG